MGKRKIYFRADAGANIGYGHFIRTLALADMLKDDFECRFFTQSPTEYQKQELEKICDFVALPSDESKFDLFLTYLEGDEIVVLDNYFFTTEYQREIKAKGCKLVCIDDLHDKHYFADVVINHSLGILETDYKAEAYTQFCLGPSYSLLRQPFLNAIPLYSGRKLREDNLHIVIGFGGVDMYNLTQCYVEKLSQLNRVEKIIAIIGDGYDSRLYVNSNKVVYCRNLSSNEIANIFSTSDVAILPSSTMTKEALCCGVRIITGYFVDNQINSYEQYIKMGVADGYGDFLGSRTVDSVLDFLLTERINTARKENSFMPANVKENLIRIFKCYLNE